MHFNMRYAAVQVTINALLSVPQRDGSLHLVRGHPSLTKRKASGRLVDIRYREDDNEGTRAYCQGWVCNIPLSMAWHFMQAWLDPVMLLM